MPPGVGVGVASIIYRWTDADRISAELLMIQRGRKHGAGKWSVPGGWVDPGEYVMQAAVREAKEEVGLDVSALEIMGWTEDHHPEGIYDVCFWVLTPMLNTMQVPVIDDTVGGEVSDWRWVGRSLMREMYVTDKLFMPVHRFYVDGGFVTALRKFRMVMRDA